MSKDTQLSFESNDSFRKSTNVENYEFEPIKGYPMLNWKGKSPFTSTRYYPAQLKESYGKPSADGWMNKIFWGDNLQVLSHLLKDYRSLVSVIYIDPPFDSNAEYKKKIKVKNKSVVGDHSIFEEKQYSDIWANDEYLQFMYDRIILSRELLSDDGAIFLHCDSNRNHYLKCILDEVYGVDNFCSEIIWKRTSAHSDSVGFGQIHDVIYYYRKSAKHITRKMTVEYEEWYKERYYRYKDNDGRKFKSGDLSAYGLSGGGYEYTWKGRKGLWRCPVSTMERLDKENKIYYTENGVPRLKQYLDEMEGTPLQSLWDDILPVVSWSEQGTEYPTQKPEDLIERIILSSTDLNGLVLDFFAGSGTTMAVALKLGRKFIGADSNAAAVKIAKNRILKKVKEIENKEYINSPGFLIYSGLQILNVNNFEIFRNPVEAKELLLKTLEIEPTSNSVFDGVKDGRMVKIMPVNRIASKGDLNDLISGFDYKSFEKRQNESPNKAVEKILLVCMGHEPDLKAHLEKEVNYKLDIEIVDILRDKQDLQFKRESEAKIKIKKDKLVIEKFYPMNLLQKLSLQKEKVTDWRELVESVLIDWNYDGAVLEPQVIDIPEKEEFVKGEYDVPETAGTIRVKITDLLSESIEVEVKRD